MNVLIIGTSSGLGKSLCEIFQKEGHTVISVSRIPNQSYPFHLTCHVGEQKGREFIIEFLSKNPQLLPNRIIYCAGLLIKKPFQEQTDEEIVAQMNVNLMAPILFTQNFMKHFGSKTHCQHLFIGSMAGYQDSKKVPGLSIYSISKAGLHTLSQVLAVEYPNSGHFFNAIALGAVKTEILSKAFDNQVDGANVDQMAKSLYDFSLVNKKMINGEIFRFDEFKI
jgi:3-oxoacyl-[acyl-carrier protein] reductase